MVDKNTALATQNPAMLATVSSQVPEYIQQNDVRGTENIGKDDIKFPALKLAQDMSPEVKRHEAAFIEGLRAGELWNSITRDNYGEDPIGIVVVNFLGHRNVEFDPNDRNVVLDGAVPDNDWRCQFGGRDGTERDPKNPLKLKKPVATKFYDYLILAIIGSNEPTVMTWSLKSTQLKKATVLNSVMKPGVGSTAKVPSFSRLFKATPVPEKGGNNSWYGWRVDLAGWVAPEVYAAASKLYDDLRDKTVAVEDTDADAGEADKDKDIPF